MLDISKLFIDIKTLPQDGYGFFQLIFLGSIYGYLLCYASNMISDGSELLLLVPAWAGLVGSVVLPILGAVPDGCIVLFSGMGPNAQEQLNVGVGALAGSTIMVLTIAWFLSVLGGRVNIDPTTKTPRYKQPKLEPENNMSLTGTGVKITPTVNTAAYMVLATCLSYFLIQVPGLLYLHSSPDEQAKGENKWALIALLTCIGFFAYYLYDQYKISQAPSSSSTQQLSRDELIRQAIVNKTITLAGVMTAELMQHIDSVQVQNNHKDYQRITELSPLKPSAISIDFSSHILEQLQRILKPFFSNYDQAGNGWLKLEDLLVVFNDLGEKLSMEELHNVFKEFDLDNNGQIDYNEFVRGVAKYIYIKTTLLQGRSPRVRRGSSIKVQSDIIEALKKSHDTDDDEGAEEEEEDDIPEDIVSLSPEEQQRKIKARAFWMMAIGTLIVLLISDPMVEVLSEVGNRSGIPAFYIAFVFAPLASNATELIAAYKYAQKKSVTSIAVALATLQGAAIMNNTFVLGVFMALIYSQGLIWEFFAETLSILVVQVFLVAMSLKKSQSLQDAYIILAFYPISLALVAWLESMGWN